MLLAFCDVAVTKYRYLLWEDMVLQQFPGIKQDFLTTNSFFFHFNLIRYNLAILEKVDFGSISSFLRQVLFGVC